MGNWKTDSVSLKAENLQFPEEEYQRKPYTPSEVVIPYKPIEEPAWCRHHRELPPKPARFQKLHRWDARSRTMISAARWAIVVAGAATVAAPVVSQLVH